MKGQKAALKVSETVINRLSHVKHTCSGVLYGVFYNKILYVIGLSISGDDEESKIVEYLPTEDELCGVFDVNARHTDHKKIDTVKSVFITDNPAYLDVTIADSNEINASIVVHERLESINIEILSEAELYAQFTHMRLKAKLPLMCTVDEDSIQDALHDLGKYSEAANVVFQFPKNNIHLLYDEVDSSVFGAPGTCTVGELHKSTVSDSVTRKNTFDQHDLDVLQVNLYKKVTQDVVTDPKKSHAPIVCVDKKKYESLVMVLNIDALSMVHRDMPLKKVFHVLLESLHRNLLILEKNILKHFSQSGGDYSKISYPEIFHFYSSLCGHFITRVYSKNQSECSLEVERKHLHRQLLLPLSRPIFRRANKHIFKGDEGNSEFLVNPHEGLKPSGNGGEVAIARGKYEYYHYCQNNMDDDGWGCAYRSLQTLASWFHLQGYTDKAVPTFKDIQKCLVDIGDKPASFVGSRQWIGSTEVNFILNSLLDVTCKIVHCSSGEEMSTVGPDLISHFKVNGSPIMIGGGVLAHTILGVDYNHDTGAIKFLILDPHYTGGENLQFVQSKGWCGWKGVSFWNKSAYYNMCLPQVPYCV